jgi:hypothetical protein
MIYPEDVKEAARILKSYHPFGSKSWPPDASFDDGKYISAIRSLVNQETNPEDGYANTSKEHVMSILSKFWDSDTRQNLYDTVNKVYSLPKQEVTRSLGSGTSPKDTYEKIFMKKLWFEVAKMTLEPAGKRDPSWIKENGLCLENLIPKKSTIPDAGFGGEFTCGYLVSHENKHFPHQNKQRFRICPIPHSQGRNRCSSPCSARGQQGNVDVI